MAFQSNKSNDYSTVINNLKKPQYTSSNANRIDDVLNQIINKPDFSYDINTDPMYAQAKQQYVNLGKESVQNALGAASQLTGGYGNSYSAQAASQANQQHLTHMNEIIPSLMDAATKRFEMEKNNLYNQFQALQSEDNRQYGMYRDEAGDYYRDWNNLQSGYSNALNQEDKDREFVYQKQRDAISDAQFNEDMAYKTARAAVADKQWQDKFDYKKERDLVADDQWQKEFDLKQLKAKKSGSSGRGRKSSGSTSVQTGLTTKDANLLFKTINNLKDADARKMLKKLVSEDYIKEEDANYLYLQYQNTDRPVTAQTTPMQMALNLASIAKNTGTFKKQTKTNKKG